MTAQSAAAPATTKQSDFIVALMKKVTSETLAECLATAAITPAEFTPWAITKGQASALITALKDAPKGTAKTQAAPVSAQQTLDAPDPAPVAATGIVGKKFYVPYADSAAHYIVTADDGEFVTVKKASAVTGETIMDDWTHPLLGHECRISRANVVAMIPKEV